MMVSEGGRFNCSSCNESKCWFPAKGLIHSCSVHVLFKFHSPLFSYPTLSLLSINIFEHEEIVSAVSWALGRWEHAAKRPPLNVSTQNLAVGDFSHCQHAPFTRIAESGAWLGHARTSHYQDPPCTLNWGYRVPNSRYLGPNRG